MTALLLTAACVHAILAAVCAAHLTAESTQVSACIQSASHDASLQRAARVPSAKVVTSQFLTLT